MSDEQSTSPDHAEEANPPALPEPSPPVEPPSSSQPPRSAAARAAGRAGRFGCFSLLLVAVAVGSLAGAGGYFVAMKRHGGASTAATERWQCPMHPAIVMDHPGECPICGMKLVKVGAASAPPKERKIKFYRSPMNPAQTSPTPRKDEMGMDYLPVYEDEADGTATPVDGLATVDIDPERRQLIGLKTAVVTKGKVNGAWRTFCRVAVDERRVRHVNVKVPVYVENVYVNFVGERVRRGQALFSGYSPELLVAQAEYRIALKTQQAIGASTDMPFDSELVKAARRKLELWDMPEAAIKKLDQGGESLKTLNFLSPIEGIVAKKDVVDGMKLDAGAMPYEIVDLSSVWVLADIYETDIRRVRIGMPGKLTLKAYPTRTFEGKSVFLDPLLDPLTRTVKLRLEFANPGGELKPGMFGEVTLESTAREGLRVPEDAVIDSGTKTVVFVAVGEGKLQPREVVLGESDGANVEIVSGLSEGEKVVVRANFLVDSESRLRASLAALSFAKTKDAPAPAASASPSSSASSSASMATSASGAPPKPASSKTAPKPSMSVTPEPSTSVAPAPRYSCLMHPEVVDTKPSSCPKCGMTLVPTAQKAP